MKYKLINISLSIILLGLIIPSSSGLGIDTTNITNDDQYTYNYYNNILNEFNNILNNIIENKNGSIEDAYNMSLKLKKIRDESIDYRLNNISSPSYYIVGYFYDFSKDLYKLSKLNYDLNKNLEENTTISKINAKVDLVEINNTINNMVNTLNNIENISILKDSDNNTLKFNVDDILNTLIIYKKVIGYKYNYLGNITTNNLTIYVSDTNPILYEEISIYGTASGNNVSVYIGNKSYIVPVNNGGVYSLKHKFYSIGNYNVYAKCGNKTSNTILIKVNKIPVKIITNCPNILEEYIDNIINIRGYVVDYYGNKLTYKTLYINNNPYTLDGNGSFEYYIYSDIPKNENVYIQYPGDDIHKSSSKNITILLKKYSINIKIWTNNTKNILVNNNITINGKITPNINRSIELAVVVNGTPIKNLHVKNSNFSFNISFNSSGKYNLYLYYDGDDYYNSAKSNILEFTVISEDFTLYIYGGVLLIIILIILILNKNKIIKLFNKNNEEDINLEENDIYLDKVNEYNNEYNNNDDGYNTENNNGDDTVSSSLNIENIMIRINSNPSISEGYNIIYNLLNQKLSLNNKPTPRELLKKVKYEIDNNKIPNIYDDLEYITKIHEKNVYGGQNITDEEYYEFIKRIKNILRELL